MITCVRCGRCSCRRHGRSSAPSIDRGDLPVRPLGAPRGDPRRPRSDPQGWVVVACLGYSRAGAGAVIFRSRRRTCWPGSAAACGRWAHCRRRWSGIASPGCTRAMVAPPTSSPASAGSCGSTGTSASRAIRRPRASSSGCRTSWSRSFEPGRRFANELDFQLQLDDWFENGPTRGSTRRCAAGLSTAWSRSAG